MSSPESIQSAKARTTTTTTTRKKYLLVLVTYNLITQGK